MVKGLRTIPVGIVTIYAAIVLILCAPSLTVFATLALTYAKSMISLWLMVGLCALLVTMVRRHRAGEPSSAFGIAAAFAHSRWRSDRFVSVLTPLFCFVTLITSYNLFKAIYLPSAGFWAGRYIALGERRLLGGHDAWQFTHGLLSSPWATQAIDLFYHGWFVPMVVGVAICSFVHPGSRLAWRYLTSYLLLWSVQGNLIAYFAPAAGPALHGSMHPGSSKFAALNATLSAQNSFLKAHGAPGLYSVEYQHALVALFGQPTVAIGGGISAMPSLHNAMAVLFACAAWAIGRRAGIAATFYALLIWIGSIHLGWHYALDGIVAAVLTILTWWAVGRLPDLIKRMSAVGTDRTSVADAAVDATAPSSHPMTSADVRR